MSFEGSALAAVVVNFCYTDDDGHFSPVRGMPLLAHRYRFVEILAHGHSSVVISVKVKTRITLL